MNDPVQLVTLWISVGTLGGLIWYCVETRRMRIAAQKQIAISQDLMKAANDQVEGLSKPCLALDSDLRDASDAIMGIGVVGNTVAAGK
jgi:hypothetical protein